MEGDHELLNIIRENHNLIRVEDGYRTHCPVCDKGQLSVLIRVSDMPECLQKQGIDTRKGLNFSCHNDCGTYRLIESFLGVDASRPEAVSGPSTVRVLRETIEAAQKNARGVEPCRDEHDRRPEFVLTLN